MNMFIVQIKDILKETAKVACWHKMDKTKVNYKL